MPVKMTTLAFDMLTIVAIACGLAWIAPKIADAFGAAELAASMKERGRMSSGAETPIPINRVDETPARAA
jgi:hypothetical protein